MKLKRYVLLNDNHIFNVNELGSYPSIDGVNPRYQVPYDYPHPDSTYTINDLVVKTSDNILDLVEVGDLIQCTYENESSDGDKWIETPIYYVNSISDKYFHLPVFSMEKTHKYISAIYKRQSNGDYKRYEVK